MVHKDDKYGDEEENLTQVRSIIKHLNEDKPAQERSREVVVRADGSKVVKVTKKRRVMLTSADVRRKNRKQILCLLIICFFLALACGAFVFFRMSTMSSSAYLQEQQSVLQRAWGAESVQLDGAGVSGTGLSLNSIIADFPESSMLQRVELSGVHAELDLTTFFSGELTAENVEVERAMLVLRDGASMQMPLQTGADMWKFRRMECKDFSVTFANEGTGPVQLKNTQAYMYYPSQSRSSSVLMLRGGNIHINGWKTVRITEGKIHVSSKGIDDMSIRGTTDAASENVEQRRTSIAFGGKIEQGTPLTGPFKVESDNMSLADFTGGRFEELFTARTVAVSHGKLKENATISFSEGGAQPVFKGVFHLKDICLSSFPALMSIQEHIEPAKRRLYNPLSLHRGYVHLDNDGESLSIEMPSGAMEERDIAALRGKLSLNNSNELSGELSYSIPMVLARVEYPDGMPDPIFQASGEWAVLSTRIKGLGNRPADDMAEVEARAAIARRSRPERIPFDKLDVNQLTDKLLNQQGGSAQEAVNTSEPVQSVQKPAPSLQSNPLEPSRNPFEEKEDPFAPMTPF